MNVLIIGLGKIARTHIKALRQIEPQCDIFALRSNNPSPAVDGVTNIYSLDGAPDFDFAIVSNPSGLHADTVERLAARRIPLFIEKPVFDSLAHDSLVRDIAASGLPTYVACNLRFLDLLLFIRRHLALHPDERVNEVNAYCGTYLPRYRADGDYRASYNARPELGGGIHIDMIHDIDYVCWLFGFPDDVRATFRNVSSLGISAYDYASYSLLYPGFTASVIINYYRRDPKRTLEIVFDDKTWIADMRANVIRDGEGRTVYTGANSVADTYRTQLEYFIRTLRDNTPVENDIVSAYRTLAVALGRIPR